MKGEEGEREREKYMLSCSTCKNIVKTDADQKFDSKRGTFVCTRCCKNEKGGIILID